jgi:hypothetical protein
MRSPARNSARDSVSPVGANLPFFLFLLSLRQPGADRSQIEQKEKQAAFGMEPHNPLYNEPS